MILEVIDIQKINEEDIYLFDTRLEPTHRLPLHCPWSRIRCPLALMTVAILLSTFVQWFGKSSLLTPTSDRGVVEAQPKALV